MKLLRKPNISASRTDSNSVEIRNGGLPNANHRVNAAILCSVHIIVGQSNLN